MLLQTNSQGAPIPALRRLPTNFGSVYLQMFTQGGPQSRFRSSAVDPWVLALRGAAEPGLRAVV
jgi:hypothetical protein